MGPRSHRRFFYGLGAAILLLIAWLLFTILSKGLPQISWGFLIKLPEEIDAGGGIGPMLFNSFYVLFLSLLISIPIGVGAGIYMAEYAPNNRLRKCCASAWNRCPLCRRSSSACWAWRFSPNISESD
ncbi:hypothetical protein HMSSN139_17110 [Paenibacillus sp. HMSSN-139]|nr:hypothetical protein HMSSN139_17110 [Paenibacillus sp. HMSSN-139]